MYTPSFLFRVGLAAFAASFAGCAGDGFDLTPTSSGPGGGGNGAASGTTSDTASTASHGGGGGGTTGTTTGVGGDEPSGPTKLTIVNGINDYDAVRVCFLPYPPGPDADPWPTSAGGLSFARSAVVDPPESIAPFDADVQPFVIAGDLTAISGKSCNEILELAKSGNDGGGGSGGGPPPPPPIVIGSMPIIPKSVLTSEKSLLLAFFGCLGGPGKTDGSQGLGCGFSYTPETPTANLTLVAMSRKTIPTAIAIQFVHASAAMQPSDIRITPGIDNAIDLPVAKALALGGLAPKPPFVGVSNASIGPLTKVALKTYAPNDIYPTSALFIQDAFVNGGVTDLEFADGSSFTFVAVGGYPGVNIPAFWHPFTYVMVRTNP